MKCQPTTQKTKWGHGSSTQCARHQADDLLVASGITSWVLRQSRIFWKQARMIAKHHEDCCTKLDSHWNPAISTKQTGYRKQGRTAQRWEDDVDIHSPPDRSKETTTIARAT